MSDTYCHCGHNADEEIYCSLACAKEKHDDGNAVFVCVRHNTINEINKLGFRA